MTALLLCNLVLTFLNVVRGLVPAVTLFSSFLYALGCFTVMVFFFVFHRSVVVVGIWPRRVWADATHGRACCCDLASPRGAQVGSGVSEARAALWPPWRAWWAQRLGVQAILKPCLRTPWIGAPI